LPDENGLCPLSGAKQAAVKEGDSGFEGSIDLREVHFQESRLGAEEDQAQRHPAMMELVA